MKKSNSEIEKNHSHRLVKVPALQTKSNGEKKEKNFRNNVQKNLGLSLHSIIIFRTFTSPIPPCFRNKKQKTIDKKKATERKKK